MNVQHDNLALLRRKHGVVREKKVKTNQKMNSIFVSNNSVTQLLTFPICS